MGGAEGGGAEGGGAEGRGAGPRCEQWCAAAGGRWELRVRFPTDATAAADLSLALEGAEGVRGQAALVLSAAAGPPVCACAQCASSAVRRYPPLSAAVHRCPPLSAAVRRCPPLSSVRCSRARVGLAGRGGAEAGLQ